MWKFDQIANSTTSELLLATEHSPQTLYEIHQLAELARRAVRGEASLEQVVRRVISYCSDRELMFGAPPGYLAASVLAGAPDPVAATFWRIASEELDARSLATLRSQFRDARPSPPLPADSTDVASGEREQWMVRVYGPADESAVVAAVRRIVPNALLVEHWEEYHPPIWIFEMVAGVDAGVAMRIASEVANATGSPASCDLPAALGKLGPEVVAFCEPGGVPALGTVDGDTPGSPVFIPIDVDSRQLS
jgi:hypothetical protein